jgi:very-short-patch-repair endonuclease
MPRIKRPASYETRIARELDRMGYEYRRHVTFKTDRGARISVDFVVNRINVILEVDGPEHASVKGRLHDRWRDDYLQSLGYFVARITHDEFDTYPDAILHALATAREEKQRRTIADREDYFRLFRVYNAFCESIAYLLDDRFDNAQVLIRGRDRDGQAIDWTFGRNPSLDDD